VQGADGTTTQRGVPWAIGADKLLIVSVGTGEFRVKLNKTSRIAALFGGRALLGIMADNQSMTLTLMQLLANPKRPWSINSEIDDLRGDDLGVLLGGAQSLLSFTRYNVNLEKEWLRKKLGIEYFSDKRLRQIQCLDDPHEMHTYLTLSRTAAAYQVTDDDFPVLFDSPKAA
jgi:hypothetical protein